MVRKEYKLFFIFLLLIVSAFPLTSGAQGVIPDHTEVVRAKVLEVGISETKNLPVLNVSNTTQSLTVQVLEGTKKDQVVVFDNDFTQLKKGDIFYLNYTFSAPDNREFFSVEDTYRMPVIYFFVVLFVVLVLLVGGVQGVRGLLSLVGSFLLIIYVLLPAILHGYPPILVSIIVSSLIIILGSYITHGFNKTTSSAVIGMIITVIFTGIMAYFAVHLSQFSGYANEEAVYLNINTRGTINMVGILIGGIMIGLLGILYDIAIGQAISVEELHNIAPHIKKSLIFKRAMRIGREHIGALVNTLAIAYVGASLPLILLFSTPPVNTLLTLNKEIFATEIIRALIGSIGLVLAVPITTLLAVAMLVKVKKLDDASVLKNEDEALKHFEHHH